MVSQKERVISSDVTLADLVLSTVGWPQVSCVGCLMRRLQLVFPSVCIHFLPLLFPHRFYTCVNTHTHTCKHCVNLCLILVQNLINEEVLGNSWTMWPVYSFLKHKHSEKWRGPLQRNTFSNNSLAVDPPSPFLFLLHTVFHSAV